MMRDCLFCMITFPLDVITECNHVVIKSMNLGHHQSFCVHLCTLIGNIRVIWGKYGVKIQKVVNIRKIYVLHTKCV